MSPFMTTLTAVGKDAAPVALAIGGGAAIARWLKPKPTLGERIGEAADQATKYIGLASAALMLADRIFKKAGPSEQQIEELVERRVAEALNRPTLQRSSRKPRAAKKTATESAQGAPETRHAKIRSRRAA